MRMVVVPTGRFRDYDHARDWSTCVHLAGWYNADAEDRAREQGGVPSNYEHLYPVSPEDVRDEMIRGDAARAARLRRAAG